MTNDDILAVGGLMGIIGLPISIIWAANACSDRPVFMGNHLY